MAPAKAAMRMTAIYILIGLVWILFSDRAAEFLVVDPASLMRVQTYKGWAYVLVTGLLFGLLAWVWLRRQQQLHERDALTGLLNLYMFRDVLSEQLDAARSAHQPLALVVVNIDDFRQLNSQLGQRQGDHLLQGFAEKLRTHFPLHASISRIAADEFCVALRGVSPHDSLLTQLETLQTEIKDTLLGTSLRQQSPAAATCSIGIAYFPQDASHSKELMSAANLALTEAKEQGRGQRCVYRESYGESINKRAQLTADLRQAQQRGELSMVYQPQFAAGGQRLVSVEALLRWSHPLHGQVPPDVFIPLAEQQGIIRALTDFACQRVLDDLTPLKLFSTLDHVSVNVSAHDINDSNALASFISRFSHNAQGAELIAAGKIQLEITETAVMQNIDHSLQLLQQLKDKGFRIAIDDFGTGYSSLGILSRLPVDELKIDRLFVRDIERNQNDLLIVRTIVAMAHALDLRVVAEGTETKNQVDLLTELNCDRLQGYYLGRPVPAAQLEALHGTRHPDSQSDP
ncbi:hypothetical protein CWE12_06275 [Aliidiomarina sedimenti]|uniref:Bifunctional diguanylate cyclase/phosphodiesterase n=1 Tax=Aliidiomarina sedimenti TaxID=1933879 RepID=A0ABY0C0D5_9GAMM|nr:bifunctional diguanylate cyclase/phosphodiesterase [Aliidiomarina sedimenti]RUO30840.1 hypothetical protein CWE12_06275 [Aliidiomarina sedimenti]